MFKQVVVYISVALLFSSSALGAITQGQTLAIGSGNAIHLAQGQQSGHWSQDLAIDLTQEGEGGSGFMLAKAYTFGSTHQVGSVWGVAGALGVNRIGALSMLGTGSLLAPAVGSTNAMLARARLNSLLLQAK